MQSCEVILGRSIGIALEPGDDVLESIANVCSNRGVRQAFIVSFSGAFRSLRLIAGTTPPLDEEIPLGEEVTVRYTEGIGSGTIVTDEAGDSVTVHLHIATGVKGRGGRAYAGHVLAGEVHYVTEVLLLEVLTPRMTRVPDPSMHGLPRLAFG